MTKKGWVKEELKEEEKAIIEAMVLECVEKIWESLITGEILI